MSKNFILSSLAGISLLSNQIQSVDATKGIPTAVFHGMRDNCGNNNVLVEELAKGTDAHVECIEIGNGVKTSMWTKFSEQADEACEKIKAHPEFQTEEFNVIGFSQGGLISRFIAENCEIKGKVRNLVTVGTPNMGTTAPPFCGNAMIDNNELDFKSFMKDLACSMGSIIGNAIVYTDFMQDDASPFGYWRDVDNLETYIEQSTFLPQLNNEVKHDKNDEQRDRVIHLNSFVAIMWDNDAVVYPRESELFDQLTSYDGKLFHSEDPKHYHYNEAEDSSPERNIIDWLPISDSSELLQRFSEPYDAPAQFRGPRKLVKLEKTDWYLNDNLGMKTLNEKGRLIKLHMPGDHDGFSIDEARDMFVPALNL